MANQGVSQHTVEKPVATKVEGTFFKTPAHTLRRTAINLAWVAIGNAQIDLCMLLCLYLMAEAPTNQYVREDFNCDEAAL